MRYTGCEYNCGSRLTSSSVVASDSPRYEPMPRLERYSQGSPRTRCPAQAATQQGYTSCRSFRTQTSCRGLTQKFDALAMCHTWQRQWRTHGSPAEVLARSTLRSRVRAGIAPCSVRRCKALPCPGHSLCAILNVARLAAGLPHVPAVCNALTSLCSPVLTLCV